MTRNFLWINFWVLILTNQVFSQNYQWNVMNTFPGSEDITWDKQNQMAFISCSERRKKSTLYKENGKILGYHNQKIMNLHDHLDFPFRPHGISYLPSQNQLYVINHRSKKYTTIEIFQFYPDYPKLEHIRTLEHKSFISPNDLHVIDNEKFYFTNDPNCRSFFYLITHFIFRWNTDKVYFYDNNKTTLFCKMNYPNGIIQIDENLLISSIYKRRIEVYDLKGKRIHSIRLDSSPDNLEIDEQNHLWTATHLNFRKFIKHLKDSTKVSPFKIYKIENPLSQAYQILSIKVEENGFSAASVAAPFRETVLVGCVFDGKILVGKKK